MKVYYALYDQSYDNHAQYWTWYPEELTRQMRDAIASKAGAFQMRPKHPNGLQDSDVDGGIINYQNKWCVVYRFFNGGNDPQGRPDRCVLATAWVKVSEAQGQNIYDLLFCPVFQEIQRLAPSQCPVDRPKELIQDYSNPIQSSDPQLKLLKTNPDFRKWRYETQQETEVVGKVFPLLIEDGLESLQILHCATPMETFSGVPLKSGVTVKPLEVEEPESEDVKLTEQVNERAQSPFLRFMIATCLALLFCCAFIKFIPQILPLNFGPTQNNTTQETRPTEMNPNGEKTAVQNPQNAKNQNDTKDNGQSPEVKNQDATKDNGQSPDVKNPDDTRNVEKPLKEQNPEGQNPEVAVQNGNEKSTPTPKETPNPVTTLETQK